MTNLERLQQRLTRNGTAPDPDILMDFLDSAKAAILIRRFPMADTLPEELEPRYLDLQYRLALAAYLKRNADYETSHSENGISRSWSSEGYPEDLLAEIVPLCGTAR